jgi:hypothetical protein
MIDIVTTSIRVKFSFFIIMNWITNNHKINHSAYFKGKLTGYHIGHLLLLAFRIRPALFQIGGSVVRDQFNWTFLK